MIGSHAKLLTKHFMPRTDDLPLFPLMHTGLPRFVTETLREVGVPTAPLPRVPLIANGCGRFVLFDSRNASSVARVQKAVPLGSQPIDLAAILTCLDETEHASPLGPQNVLAKCVEHIKHELEARGGVWLRTADFPFPYHSAMCAAIGYVAGVEPAEVVPNLPQKMLPRLSHFISTRSRLDQLSFWCGQPGADLGWLVEPDDVGSSRRKTLSHWSTRIERFREAGMTVRGLMLTSAGLRWPAVRDLSALGFSYSGQPDRGNACQTDSLSGSARGDWVRLGMLPAADAVTTALRDYAIESPRRAATGTDVRLDTAHVLAPEAGELFDSLDKPERGEALHEYVRAHYLAGSPLFLLFTAGGHSLDQALRTFQSAAARCPLMWQPTIGEFVRWWRLRKQLAVQVWRRDGGYEISVRDGVSENMPWAIEIWKGNHVATLPLKQAEMRVAEEGLVFTRAETKSCSGISLAPHHPLAPRAKLLFSKSSCQDDSHSSHFSHGKDS